MKSNFLFVIILGISANLFGQTTVDIFLDSIQLNIGSKYQPGIFYVPKTIEAQNDFFNNEIRQNAIRLNIIEGALNNTSNLNVIAISGPHSGVNYKIDSTNNNFQFKYDSLLTQGFSQVSSIMNITGNQSLLHTSMSLTDGQTYFLMQSNSVQLFQFLIPKLLGVNRLQNDLNLLVYPNPTDNKIRIESEKLIGEIFISNISGKVIKTLESTEKKTTINLSEYESGVYFMTFINLNKTVKIIRK